MRIGFLGAGLIGDEHLTGLSDLLSRGIVDGRLAGIFDPDETRARSCCEKHGIERLFPSAEALIGAADIDLVFIAAWTSAHHDLVAACCQEHKPVFCEKPLARDLAEAKAMQRLVTASGTPNQVGLILRTSPAYGFTRQLMRDTDLGRLMVVNFRDDQYFPVQGRYGSDWRADRALAGGGTFIEHSIHDVDLMRWMFGDLDRVQAVTANHAGFEGIEDLALVDARFAAGGHVRFLSVWHQILNRPSSRFLEIFFERGRVTVAEEVFGPVVLERSDRPQETFEPADIARWYLEHNEDLVPLGLQVASPQQVEDYRFLTAVAQGRSPTPSFAEAVAAHEVVEAAYRAAASGQAHDLPLTA